MAAGEKFRITALLKREIDHTGVLSLGSGLLLVIFLVIAYPYKGPTLLYFFLAYSFALTTLTCYGDFEGSTLLYLLSRPLKRIDVLKAKAVSISGQFLAMLAFLAILEVSHTIFHLRAFLLRIVFDERTAAPFLKEMASHGDVPVSAAWSIWASCALLVGSLIGIAFGSRLCDDSTTSQNRSLPARISLRMLAVVLATSLCVVAHRHDSISAWGIISLVVLATALFGLCAHIVPRFVRMDVL